MTTGEVKIFGPYTVNDKTTIINELNENSKWHEIITSWQAKGQVWFLAVETGQST